MKVLVTGRDGQLARSLGERGGGFDIVFVGRPELDLERPETVLPVIERLRPDVIVSAAAWTSVDEAEDEVERAMIVNAEGPRALARAARKLGARLLHLSTDYVFDGAKDGPYAEADPVNPQGAYGSSKLAGEIAIREELDEHLILRTAWLYSPHGRNFVKTMLTLAGQRDHLRVVEDQMGSPTSAPELADVVLQIASRWRDGNDTGLGQTYHAAGSGTASWAELARHVMTASRAAGGPFAKIEGISSDAWPARAHRPRNSRLDCTRLGTDFGLQMPHWHTSVRETVDRLLKQAGAP